MDRTGRSLSGMLEGLIDDILPCARPPVKLKGLLAYKGPAQGGIESSLMSLLPLILMFVVLYFIMIRPQMKRQKEHKAMVDALAKGDEVVTAGGLYGKISKVGESNLHIEVAEGVEVMVQRQAVTQVLPKGSIK
jgi:preprotein translocase subunit YajC